MEISIKKIALSFNLKFQHIFGKGTSKLCFIVTKEEFSYFRYKFEQFIIAHLCKDYKKRLLIFKIVNYDCHVTSVRSAEV